MAEDAHEEVGHKSDEDQPAKGKQHDDAQASRINLTIRRVGHFHSVEHADNYLYYESLDNIIIVAELNGSPKVADIHTIAKCVVLHNDGIGCLGTRYGSLWPCRYVVEHLPGISRFSETHIHRKRLRQHRSSIVCAPRLNVRFAKVVKNPRVSGGAFRRSL